MGNLGAYQDVVKIMKSLGGPGKAAALVLGGTFIAGVVARDRVPVIIQKIRARRRPSEGTCEVVGATFDVVSESAKHVAVGLDPGSSYRILECMGDALLIEVLGKEDNPHVVSSRELESVSGLMPHSCKATKSTSGGPATRTAPNP